MSLIAYLMTRTEWCSITIQNDFTYGLKIILTNCPGHATTCVVLLFNLIFMSQSDESTDPFLIRLCFSISIYLVELSSEQIPFYCVEFNSKFMQRQTNAIKRIPKQNQNQHRNDFESAFLSCGDQCCTHKKQEQIFIKNISIRRKKKNEK